MTPPDVPGTPRIAWKCDECGEAAIVTVSKGNHGIAGLNALARASHAHASPKCRATKLNVKYLDIPLN